MTDRELAINCGIAGHLLPNHFEIGAGREDVGQELLQDGPDFSVHSEQMRQSWTARS
jgi:hypothetical protein